MFIAKVLEEFAAKLYPDSDCDVMIVSPDFAGTQVRLDPTRTFIIAKCYNILNDSQFDPKKHKAIGKFNSFTLVETETRLKRKESTLTLLNTKESVWILVYSFNKKE